MKQTLKQKLDDVFEDMNSYTGVKLAEDELFDRVLELLHSHTQEVVEKIKGMPNIMPPHPTMGYIYELAISKSDVLALLKEDNNK